MTATTFLPQSIYAAQAGLVGANAAGLCRLLTAEEVKALAGLASGDSPTFAGMTIAGTLGDLSVKPTGSEVEFSHHGVNYIRATSLGASLNFGTGGIDGRLSIASNGFITTGGSLQSSANLSASGTVSCGASQRLEVGSRLWLSSPETGIARLTDNTGNQFNRLQLGGGTSAFPAIKRNGTAINFRLADDTADAPISAGSITASGTVSANRFVGNSVGYTVNTTDGTRLDFDYWSMQFRRPGQIAATLTDEFRIHPSFPFSWGTSDASSSSDLRLYRNAAGQLDVRGNSGLRVRNFANTADAPLTASHFNSNNLTASNYNLGLGQHVSSVAFSATALGWSAAAAHNNSIAIGTNAATSQSGQLSIGSAQNITQMRFGDGTANVSIVNPITANAGIAIPSGMDFRSGSSGWTEVYPFVHWRLGGYTNGLTLYKTFDSGFLAIPSYSQYAFSSTSASNGTRDTALGRVSAGVVEINNGTALASGGTLGSLNVANLTASGNLTVNGQLSSNGIYIGPHNYDGQAFYKTTGSSFIFSSTTSPGSRGFGFTGSGAISFGARHSATTWGASTWEGEQAILTGTQYVQFASNNSIGLGQLKKFLWTSGDGRNGLSNGQGEILLGRSGVGQLEVSGANSTPVQFLVTATDLASPDYVATIRNQNTQTGFPIRNGLLVETTGVNSASSMNSMFLVRSYGTNIFQVGLNEITASKTLVCQSAISGVRSSLISNNATIATEIVRATSGQTANLTEWQDSSGTVQASMSLDFLTMPDNINKGIRFGTSVHAPRIGGLGSGRTIRYAVGNNASSIYYFDNRGLNNDSVNDGGEAWLLSGGANRNQIMTITGILPTGDFASHSIRVRAGSANADATTNITGGDIEIVAGSGSANSAGNADGGDVTITPGTGYGTGRDGLILLQNLPTADPVVTGALWNDGGTLKISAG